MPTKIAGISTGAPSRGNPVLGPHPTENPALENAIYKGTALTSGGRSGSVIYSSGHTRPICGAPIVTLISAYVRARAISDANAVASKSQTAVIQTAVTFPFRVWSSLNCASVRWRGSNCSSARAARSVAAVSLSVSRFRSSLWMWPFHIVPSTTSTVMPSAIIASVTAESVKKELYGGSTQASTTSAITASTTAPAPPRPQRSHDVDAFSNSLLLAYIVPFGRYHAGKGSFRAFLIGMGLAALMFLILYVLGVFVL